MPLAVADTSSPPQVSSENSQISAERPRGVVAESPTLSLSFDANRPFPKALSTQLKVSRSAHWMVSCVPGVKPAGRSGKHRFPCRARHLSAGGWLLSKCRSVCHRRAFFSGDVTRVPWLAPRLEGLLIRDSIFLLETKALSFLQSLQM